MKTFGNIIIVADSKKEAKKYCAALELELKKREALIVPSSQKSDIELVVALGGDGTMLKAVHLYDFKPIFLGINCGHVGYLMNNGDPSNVADIILDEEFKVRQFPLLEIETAFRWNDPAITNQKYFAMNDVYFNRIAGPACKVNVKVDGVEIAERIVGDGIVISTALGSTGYFVPARGSAINPEIPAIGLAPLHVHTPIQFLPMILPLSSEIEVALLSPAKEIKGFYDGIELPYFKKIIVRKSDRTVRLAFFREENFTKRLITKIMKVQEVKNG